mgnify:CR=1 FL=1|jgi:hypothetical protein
MLSSENMATEDDIGAAVTDTKLSRQLGVMKLLAVMITQDEGILRRAERMEKEGEDRGGV